MGIFQKVNGWLADRGDHIARDGDANRTANNAYYASSEAEQAYSGMRKPAADASATSDPRTAGNETGRYPAADHFNAEPNDKYGGRVPYRSQKDMQAEADLQRQQQEEQMRRQQNATQQMKAQQQFVRSPAQASYQQPQSNIVQFPGMLRGPEGNLYAHVEYVVLLRSRNECTKVIEYIKANASVFLNMEFIANDSERQRCVDMLSGAAYTLGCQLNKISQRGIYLISSPSVCVVIDPAMQKYATAPESQGYVRPEYSAYGSYNAQTPGYGAQGGNYAAGGVRASGYSAQQPAAGYTPSPRTAAYGDPAQAGNMPGARTSAYTTPSPNPGYASGVRTAAYGTNPPTANYSAGSPRTAAYATQPANTGYPAGTRTAAYNAQPAAGAQTGAYPPQSTFTASGQTGSYAAQAGIGQSAQNMGAQPNQRQQQSFGAGAQPKRAMPTFSMQGAFTKSAESGANR